MPGLAPPKRSAAWTSPPAYGAAYPLMLEHVLDSPRPYKMPLKAMYLTNAAARPMSTRNWSSPSSVPALSPSSSTSTSSSPSAAASPSLPPMKKKYLEANAEFMASLMSHVSRLPSQPCSLPPAFLTSFLRRCFTLELHLVDFPQALIGIDYLQDLNKRRRHDTTAAKSKLGAGLSKKSGMDEMSKLSPGIATWVKEMENSERKAEALFTQLYVALRRWVLINEMSLQPFNRHNALAMLNTLYSPFTSSQIPPSAALTPSVLAKQRSGFLNYIGAVDSRGTGVLKPLMDQGKREGLDGKDATGWPSVFATLDTYLRVTKHIIDDCSCISSGADMESPKSQSSKQFQVPKVTNHKRKAESSVGGINGAGVLSLHATLANKSASSPPSAFHTGPNPNTKRTSTHANKPSISSIHSTTQADLMKPLPSRPEDPCQATAKAATTPITPSEENVKDLTKIEHISHELRRIRSRRQLRDEFIHPIYRIPRSDEEDKENLFVKLLDRPSQRAASVAASEQRKRLPQSSSRPSTAPNGAPSQRPAPTSAPPLAPAKSTVAPSAWKMDDPRPTPATPFTSKEKDSKDRGRATSRFKGISDLRPFASKEKDSKSRTHEASSADSAASSKASKSSGSIPRSKSSSRATTKEALASQSRSKSRSREMPASMSLPRPPLKRAKSSDAKSGRHVSPATGLGAGKDFDEFEMQRERMLYEARRERAERDAAKETERDGAADGYV